MIRSNLSVALYRIISEYEPCHHSDNSIKGPDTDIPFNKVNETKKSLTSYPLWPVTATWALSEAALGGVLHALRIPFTGMFIGGSAVIFITLLGVFSTQKGAILRAMLLVMIVKALVSPHSPPPAYMAIAFQGVIGEFLFRWIRVTRLAALLLALLAMAQSALQKLIVLTLVFGRNLWESIDLFGNYIIGQFLPEAGTLDWSISLFLITVYCGLHILTGLITGLWAPSIAAAVQNELSQNRLSPPAPQPDADNHQLSGRKPRPLLKRKGLLLLGVVAVSVVILSYVFPVFEKSKGMAALIMIIRSVVLLSLWFFLLAPYLTGKLRTFLSRKQSLYAGEIDQILKIFPLLKAIIRNSWQRSGKYTSLKRIHFFIVFSLTQLMTINNSNP